MTSGKEHPRSAYDPDAFRPRSAPDASGREHFETHSKPDSERMREMFDRVERADRRAKEIQQKLQSRIQDLNSEISQTEVLERATPMQAKRQEQESLQAFLNRYSRIAQEYLSIRLDDGNGRILPLATVHAALDERMKIVDELENMLREFEPKAGLESPPPEVKQKEPVISDVSAKTTERVRYSGERMKSSVDRLYPYGWRDGRGTRGGHEHIILSFSTGWGRDKEALATVSGNQGAMQLGLPQSIMFNNIRGVDPLSQTGTERGFLAAKYEADEMGDNRRALEEMGISVQQTENGTRVNISYIPENEYVVIEGEKIWGPVGRRPVPDQGLASQSSGRSRVRDAGGLTGSERRAQMGLDRMEGNSTFNGRREIRDDGHEVRRTGRTQKKRAPAENSLSQNRRARKSPAVPPREKTADTPAGTKKSERPSVAPSTASSAPSSKPSAFVAPAPAKSEKPKASKISKPAEAIKTAPKPKTKPDEFKLPAGLIEQLPGWEAKEGKIWNVIRSLRQEGKRFAFPIDVRKEFKSITGSENPSLRLSVQSGIIKDIAIGAEDDLDAGDHLGGPSRESLSHLFFNYRNKPASAQICKKLEGEIQDFFMQYETYAVKDFLDEQWVRSMYRETRFECSTYVEGFQLSLEQENIVQPVLREVQTHIGDGPLLVHIEVETGRTHKIKSVSVTNDQKEDYKLDLSRCPKLQAIIKNVGGQCSTRVLNDLDRALSGREPPPSAAKPAESSAGSKGISGKSPKPTEKPTPRSAPAKPKETPTKPASPKPAEKPEDFAHLPEELTDISDFGDSNTKEKFEVRMNALEAHNWKEKPLSTRSITAAISWLLGCVDYIQRKVPNPQTDAKRILALARHLQNDIGKHSEKHGTWGTLDVVIERAQKLAAKPKEKPATPAKEPAETKPSKPQPVPKSPEQVTVDPELGNRVMTQLKRSFTEAKLLSIKLKQVQVKPDGTVLLFGDASEDDIKKCGEIAQKALNGYMKERKGKNPAEDLIKWPNGYKAPRVNTDNMKKISGAKPVVPAAKAEATPAEKPDEAKPVPAAASAEKPKAKPEMAKPQAKAPEKLKPETQKMLDEVTGAVQKGNLKEKVKVAVTGGDHISLKNAGSATGIQLKKEGDSWMIMRDSDQESGLYSNLSAELSSLEAESDLKEMVPVLTWLLFEKKKYTEDQKKDERNKTQDALTQLAQEKQINAIWLYANENYENFEAMRTFTQSNLEKVLGALDPKYLNVLKQLPLVIGTAHRAPEIVTVNGQRFLSLPCSLPAADMKKSLVEFLQRELVRQKLDEDLKTLVPGVTIFLWNNFPYKDYGAIERSKNALIEAINLLTPEEKKGLPSIVIEEDLSAAGLQTTGRNSFGTHSKVIGIHPGQTPEQMKEILQKGVQQFASYERLGREMFPQLAKELRLKDNRGVYQWSDRTYKDYPTVERSLDTIRLAVTSLTDEQREALRDFSLIISDQGSPLIGVQETSKDEKIIAIDCAHNKEQMKETIEKALKELKGIPMSEKEKGKPDETKKAEERVPDLGDGLEVPYRLIRSGAQGSDVMIAKALDELLPKIETVKRVKKADLERFTKEIDSQINNNKKLTDGTREKLEKLKEALK